MVPDLVLKKVGSDKDKAWFLPVIRMCPSKGDGQINT